MNGLSEQVVERFKLSWRLQPWDFAAPDAKYQAARFKSRLPLFHDFLQYVLANGAEKSVM
jgi:hypothetical protein